MSILERDGKLAFTTMPISPAIRKRMLILYIGLFVVHFSLLTASLLVVKINLWVSGAMLLAMPIIGLGAILLADRELRKAVPRMFCKKRDRTPAEQLWATNYLRRVVNNKPTAINVLLMVAGLLAYLRIHYHLQGEASVSFLVGAGLFFFGLCLGTLCGYAGTQIRLAIAEDFLTTTQGNEIIGASLKLPTH